MNSTIKKEIISKPGLSGFFHARSLADVIDSKHSADKNKDMNALEQARKEINEIDEQMAHLYELRMKAAAKVAQYKKDHDLAIFDPRREADLIEVNKQYIDTALQEQYEKFLRFLLAQSKDYQQSIISQDIITYAGVAGAFSEYTSKKLFPFHRIEGREDFKKVVESVLNHEAKYGVIPLENTNAGLIGEVLDLLYAYPIYIINVYDQRIEQCLLGLKESTLKDIEKVYSKDVALEQVAGFLDALGVERVNYSDTAKAAKFIAEKNDKSLGAVGSRENAELYDLKVLADNIEETKTNTTRFLVISTKPEEELKDNVALIVSVKNEVGALGECLKILARHNLDMSSIQSRPIKERPFEYFFFIQCSGKLEKENLEQALKELEPHTLMVKNLGSYSIENRQ